MAKIRLGFVSNSSSSSFIIASKEKPNMTIKTTINLDNFIDYIITNKKDLDKYFLEEVGYNSIDEMISKSEWYKDIYQECLKELDKGETIYMGEVSNNGENEEFLLFGIGFDEYSDKNFKIIKNLTRTD